MQTQVTKITDFITRTVHEAGFENVIIGLSGGIDSALVTTLCQKALGNEHVHGVILPYQSSNPASQADAEILANNLQIKYEIYPITAIVDAYFSNFEPDADSLRRGNYMARTRMCVLYDLSAKYRALVAGTSNMSELYVGYCTQHGDSACAFEPIAHLLKTEVRAMSKELSIPQSIIDKAPSADLWTGQTDEGEMGITYERLDTILTYLIREKRDREYILSKGVTEGEYTLVLKKIKQSEFKRHMPPVIGDWSSI